jgi:hypothetical protein
MKIYYQDFILPKLSKRAILKLNYKVILSVSLCFLFLPAFAQQAGDNDLSFNMGTGINSGTGTVVRDIECQPDGKVLVGGYFNAYNNYAMNKSDKA